MPIRIYEIAKRLGLENQAVLLKAKELGITAARIPSSSLDKITAEYLEEKLGGKKITEVPVPQPSHPTATQFKPPIETDPPPAPSAQVAQGTITIKANSPDLYRLVEKVLAGEVQFQLEVTEAEGNAPIRAQLVKEGSEEANAEKPKNDSPPRAEITERTKKLFRAAYYDAVINSEDEWANLADLGNALKKKDALFQPQDFGERSLGSLLRRMTDVFEIRSDENNPIVHYVRIKRDAALLVEGTEQTGLGRASSAVALPIPSALPQLATGVVHNLKLGFGFIAPDDGSENVFFHATEVVGCTIFDIRPGDPVEYEPGVNERGLCARKVRRVKQT